MRVVNNTLSTNFVRPDEANKVQSMVKDKGKHTLIDKIKVRYLSDDDKHWAELVNFGHKYVHIPEHYLRDFDRLLMGGIWAQIEIRHQYDEDATGKRSPFWIDGLKPIQLASFDLDEVADLQKMPKEVVTTLKTYCESGMFARGKDSLSGTASLALFGNTNQPVDVMVRSSHLFAPMPDVIREDMAFIDRLHYYLPGWEIPKMRVEFFTDHYGFVVDYLSEALRELRKHNFTEVIDRHYSLGSHLNARDVKAVRKTVSGLVKLIYPDGEVSREELAELVEIALEGRRRVKEQLKKMGSFEYHQTSFSYLDNDTRDERFVGMPEQGGREMISTDPLAPGSVYTASVDDQRKVGLYRLEVSCSPGTGKLKIAGGVEGPMKESIQRAFAYLMGQKVRMGVAQQVDTTDFHVEAIDLLSNHVPCESGIALVVAIYSAIKKHSVLAGLLIMGDLTIQRNIKSVRSLAEPLQVGMDNGARRALVPLENKRNFLDVSGDIVERVDPVFFSDPMTAAMKALGMN